MLTLPRNLLRALPLAVGPIAVGVWEPAHAEETGEAEARQAGGDTLSYPAEFFADYHPQTALDMLERIPGFAADVAAEQVRGFGNNAGNVLIGGRRPTVKSGTVAEVLLRIAATRVERIEILRGVNLAEAPGQSVVANIILTASGEGSGNASLVLRRAPGDAVTPSIDVSYARTLGGWDLTGSVAAYVDSDPFHGRYDWFDADGALTASAREIGASKAKGVTLAGTAAHLVGGGMLNLNGRAEHHRWNGGQEVIPLTGPAAASELVAGERETGGEIGGDWTRALGRDWSFKLVGLGRTSKLTAREEILEDGYAANWRLRATTNEYVGRGTLSRQGAHKLTAEVGVEAAWNDLSSRFDYFEAGLPIADASSATKVSESRGEAFAKATYKASADLSLEGGVAFEASRISVAAGPTTSLTYLKPSGAVVWNASDSTQVRLAAARTVGQLDFELFAASGDLENDRPIAGNSELRPEIEDSLSLAFDHRFAGAGAVSITGARERIDHALAYVPLEDGGQALVNVGTVKQWSIKGVGTLPLGGLLPNAELKLEGSAVWARRLDPITGERRDDTRAASEAMLSFRHDVPQAKMAYGITATIASFEREWYVDERERERQGAELSVFVETTAIKGVKVTLNVDSILGERDDRYRVFHAPDRSGPRIGSEYRSRSHGAYAYLTVAGQF